MNTRGPGTALPFPPPVVVQLRQVTLPQLDEQAGRVLEYELLHRRDGQLEFMTVQDDVPVQTSLFL